MRKMPERSTLMKIIRITTDLEMTVHDFPEGTHEEQNHELREEV